MFLPFVETPQYDITNLQYPVENGVHELYINLEIPLGDGSELDHLLHYIKETTEENEDACFGHIIKSVKECREGDDEIMKYYSSHEFFEEGKDVYKRQIWGTSTPNIWSRSRRRKKVIGKPEIIQTR